MPAARLIHGVQETLTRFFDVEDELVQRQCTTLHLDTRQGTMVVRFPHVGGGGSFVRRWTGCAWSIFIASATARSSCGS